LKSSIFIIRRASLTYGNAHSEHVLPACNEAA